MPRKTGSRAADFKPDELSRIRRALEVVVGQDITADDAEDNKGEDWEEENE